MDWLANTLGRFPELAVFLAIALGYLIGEFKLKTFSLGPVTGALFAGLLIGYLVEVPVSSATKSFLFLLFLFGIGYSVGPQFLQALRQAGVKPLLLAVVCCTSGLATAYLVSIALGLDAGFSAGLLSGGLTQSPAMGTATEAIKSLAITEEEQARLIAHIGVADAVCYVFGAAGAIWFCSVLGPRLLRIDLTVEARKLEADLGIERSKPGIFSGRRVFELRAYAVPSDAAIVGKTVADAERSAADNRFFIQRMRRNGSIMEVDPGLTVQSGDILAISGRREAVVEVLNERAREVDDGALLDMPLQTADVLLSQRRLAGMSLQEVASQDWGRGIYLRSLSRGGQAIPIAPGVRLERGDLLSVVGPQQGVARAVPHIGTIVAPTTATDFVTLGLAIFCGGIVGILIHFPIAGIEVSLGTSIGALLAGLTVGHLRTRHPLFGRIPDGAVSLMTALGLAAFVAMTGLHAGPIFLSAIAEAGLGLLLGGIAVTLVPYFVGLVFGWWVLRMNPILLLGALAGSLTMTAAMAAVQSRSDSPVAVLGYTPAYPIGQILLTVWGSVIVSLMA
jgi:putative transport protein